MAAGPVAPGSLLHHPDPDGAVDVRALQGGADGDAAQSPDQDDALRDAGVHDVPVPALRFRGEPLLLRLQSGQHSAAVSARPAAATGAREAVTEVWGRGGRASGSGTRTPC